MWSFVCFLYLPAGSPVIGPRVGIYPLAPLWLVPAWVYTRWLPCGWSPRGDIPAGSPVIGPHVLPRAGVRDPAAVAAGALRREPKWPKMGARAPLARGRGRRA
eukprot:2654470-Pyramimonas_sp.AAC.1